MSTISGVGTSPYTGVSAAGGQKTNQQTVPCGVLIPYNPEEIGEKASAPVYDEYGNFIHTPEVADRDWAKRLSGTTADGTSVTVSPQGTSGKPDSFTVNLGTGSGKELSVDFTGDLRIGKAENGDYLVYSSKTHTTTRYNADGTTTVADGDTTVELNDKIYVSTSGSSVQGGDGDETFFIYGKNTTVSCGAGNDKVFLGDYVENVHVDLGTGDNTLRGKQALSTTITGGDGANTVQLQAALDCNITLGNGNNTIGIREHIGGRLTMGDGNNTINAGKVQGAEIVAGNGDNRFECATMSKYASFTTGDGNNSVKISELGNFVYEEYASISRMSELSDKGFENLTEEESLEFLDLIYNRPILGGSSASLTLGKGNNDIIIKDVVYGSSIKSGDGNNKIVLQSMDHRAEVELGDGDNYIKIESSLNHNSKLSVGDGTNVFYRAVQMVRGSSCSIGGGENYAQGFDYFYKVKNGEFTDNFEQNEDFERVYFDRETNSYVKKYPKDYFQSYRNINNDAGVVGTFTPQNNILNNKTSPEASNAFDFIQQMLDMKKVDFDLMQRVALLYY